VHSRHFVSLTTFNRGSNGRHCDNQYSVLFHHYSEGVSLLGWAGYTLGFATHVGSKFYRPTERHGKIISVTNFISLMPNAVP